MRKPKLQPDPHVPGQPWDLLNASRFLRRSKSTLSRGIKSGAVRAIYFGRNVMIPDAELLRLAEHGLVPPAEPLKLAAE